MAATHEDVLRENGPTAATHGGRPPENGPTAATHEDLRTVLTRLLAAGGDYVTVVDDEGRAVARLGYEDLRVAAAPPGTTQS